MAAVTEVLYIISYISNTLLCNLGNNYRVFLLLLYLVVDRPSPLLWVPTETLGRALKSCQSVLEGGPVPDSNRGYFHSALGTTVRVLDSILYLNSKRINPLARTSFLYYCSSPPKNLIFTIILYE